MPKHFTVVYTVADGQQEAFETQLNQIHESMKAYDPQNPPAWGVSAMSRDNEIQRLELIEQALDNFHGSDATDEIQDILGKHPVC
jgi:hypothetical protein